MVYEERLALLKKLQSEQDKYNKKDTTQHAESIILNEVIQQQQGPTIKAIKELEVLKFKELEDKQDLKELPWLEDLNIKPLILDPKINVSLSKTIKPTFNINVEGYQIITINKHDFLLYLNSENKSRIHSQNVYNTKHLDFEFTDDFYGLVCGYPSENVDLLEIKKYLNLIELVHGSAKAKHIQDLKKYRDRDKTSPQIQIIEEPKEIEGEGLNPINLFIELRKLLAAKKAGHNNLDSDILKISKELLKQGIISKDKFNKYTKL